jgi:uncharacterized protein YggU (UPF0235/DUF167 family)
VAPPQPARLTLRVVPNANVSGLVGRHGEAWKLRVAAPAEDGRANRAVVELLAGLLAVDRRGIRVVAGTSSRDKLVEIDGLSAAQADAALERSVPA